MLSTFGPTTLDNYRGTRSYQVLVELSGCSRGEAHLAGTHLFTFWPLGLLVCTPYALSVTPLFHMAPTRGDFNGHQSVLVLLGAHDPPLTFSA